jgi:hypothetical protein
MDSGVGVLLYGALSRASEARAESRWKARSGKGGRRKTEMERCKEG